MGRSADSGGSWGLCYTPGSSFKHIASKCFALLYLLSNPHPRTFFFSCWRGKRKGERAPAWDGTRPRPPGRSPSRSRGGRAGITGPRDVSPREPAGLCTGSSLQGRSISPTQHFPLRTPAALGPPCETGAEVTGGRERLPSELNSGRPRGGSGRRGLPCPAVLRGAAPDTCPGHSGPSPGHPGVGAHAVPRRGSQAGRPLTTGPLAGSRNRRFRAGAGRAFIITAAAAGLRVGRSPLRPPREKPGHSRRGRQARRSPRPCGRERASERPEPRTCAGSSRLCCTCSPPATWAFERSSGYRHQRLSQRLPAEPQPRVTVPGRRDGGAGAGRAAPREGQGPTLASPGGTGAPKAAAAPQGQGPAAGPARGDTWPSPPASPPPARAPLTSQRGGASGRPHGDAAAAAAERTGPPTAPSAPALPPARRLAPSRGGLPARGGTGALGEGRRRRRLRGLTKPDAPLLRYL